MKSFIAFVTLVAIVSTAQARGSHAVHVRADRIGDAVELKGVGAFDEGQVTLAGRFRITQDIVAGPLGGLRTGDTGRWKATAILPTSGFKCTGADALRNVDTDDDTVVFQADFFRQGDFDHASFTAKIFISAQDENPDLPGVQNVWIQGVGCDQAEVDLR